MQGYNLLHRIYAWQGSLNWQLGVCAWQAPSLAIMVGVTGYSIWRGTNLGRELLKVVSDAPFRTLCAESLSASADGRLPGNLGDAPETMETGRGTG